MTKYIHADGSETSIKSSPSGSTIVNPVTGALESNNEDRNKYTVFISHSAGCYMKCKFCYLTIKDMKYSKLNSIDIYHNVMDAIKDAVEYNPSLKSKYVKLSWMGMGDAVIDNEVVVGKTLGLVEAILNKGYAKGLDGVDLSTVLPKIRYPTRWMQGFEMLNIALKQYPSNPNNDIAVHREASSTLPELYIKRSPFRVFYSVHSAIQETRDEIIPNATPLAEALHQMRYYSNGNKRNVIFHHMFIDGVNDSPEEVTALMNMLQNYALHKHELRILRYNACKQLSDIQESDKFNEIISRLSEVHKFLKVQISTGKDVQSACGQFITNK